MPCGFHMGILGCRSLEVQVFSMPHFIHICLLWNFLSGVLHLWENGVWRGKKVLCFPQLVPDACANNSIVCRRWWGGSKGRQSSSAPVWPGELGAGCLLGELAAVAFWPCHWTNWNKWIPHLNSVSFCLLTPGLFQLEQGTSRGRKAHAHFKDSRCLVKDTFCNTFRDHCSL